VAHDFNNLLTGVMLYCDLLLTGLEPGSRLRQYAEEIRGAGVQAAGVVRQLLEVAGKRAGTSRTLCLNREVTSMRNLLGRLIGENIELVLLLAPDLSEVRMDLAHLQQVLMNLVLNARDALPGGGSIVIETGIQGECCPHQEWRGGANVPHLPCAYLAVSDNGHGMDPETERRAFERFFSTKQAGQGSGIGLATVFDIVKSYAGFVQVESGQGRGTRICVLLPTVRESEVSKPADSDSSNQEHNGE